MTIPLNEIEGSDPNSLVNLLDTVLERIVSAYEQAGIELPERRYWTLETPAADCEQLVVSLVQVYNGAPGQEATEPSFCNSPRSATLNIQILRCIPAVRGRNTTPTAESIQEASRPMAIDAWMLLDMASSLDTWDPFGGPGLGVIATVNAGQAQGGFQGPTMVLTLAVP